MKRQQTPFRLSPTLEKIYKKLSGEGEIPSIHIIQILNSLHPEYGNQGWPDLSSVRTTQLYPFEEWLQRIASQFNTETVNELHGRLVILGLALTDTELTESLLENKFLQKVASELSETDADLFTPDAYQQWQSLIATPPTGPIDNVPTHSDHPTIVDELGRRAFARALAKRIQRVRDSEEWRSAAAMSRKPVIFQYLRDKIGILFGSVKSTEKVPKFTHCGAFMMHIHGPWGSGKSSLLNFIRDELQDQPGDERWITIYFNAWKYQRLGPPWWALTREVYKQALDQLDDEQKASTEDLRRARLIFLNELWHRIFTGWGGWLFAGGIFLWVTTLGWLNALNDIAKLLTFSGTLLAGGRYILTGSARGANALLEMSGDPMGPLVQRFNQLILNTGHPVIIFIDDLDRCDAEYVIKLLHGIQTMYWGTQVAYVVAADRHWLRAAYEKSYTEFSQFVGEPGRPMGYLFLEKLFQLSASVPQLDTNQIKHFWHNLIGIDQEKLDEKLKESRIKAASDLKEQKTEGEILDYTEQIAKDPNADQLYLQALREESVVRLAERDIEQHTEHTLKAFSSLLEPNPRAMKRMVNAYAIRRAIVIIGGMNIDREILALWTILELRWPLLSEYLMAYPDAIECIRKDELPTDNQLEENLISLFKAQEVLRVLDGDAEGIKAKLTADDIRECTGHRAAVAISGSMV